jgi:hypothetical protein
MAAKSVSVNLINHPLSREETGVTFNVSIDGSKFGELVVSKGGIRWKPKGKQDHHHMRWGKLDELMRDLPKR